MKCYRLFHNPKDLALWTATGFPLLHLWRTVATTDYWLTIEVLTTFVTLKSLLLLLLSPSVVSDSVWPHRRQPTRLPRPWDSPGKNTGVGCHFLLQCMKVKSEREVAQLCPTPSDPMDCSPPDSSVHGLFQARVLEWGATAFSIKEPSFHQISVPCDGTHTCCGAGWFQWKVCLTKPIGMKVAPLPW